MRAVIYVSRLKLVNFRNYERLDLELEPGMILVHGGNGQGKSNLLEALYLLAIAKSPRAGADRELVRWGTDSEDMHTQVSTVVARKSDEVRVQIDLRGPQAVPSAGVEAAGVEKSIRINGVPKRASDLVGEVNAVMFGAPDLDILLGAPQLRRRYVDILIAQFDRRYVRSLQKYQRVVYQRNHLLKAIRSGHSKPSELEYWDNELTDDGQYIVARRLETVATLSDLVRPLHYDLAGNDEDLELVYEPTVEVRSGDPKEGLDRAFSVALEQNRDKEIASGFTVVGPHRDDLRVMLNGKDVGTYASRGQCRTVVLAMRLAEAGHLANERGQEPVLLLDDVLSELDATRRETVLETVGKYEQCIVTATDTDAIEPRFRERMAPFRVRGGRIEPDHGGPAPS